MWNWLGKILCLAAALAVADLPLLVVQGVAWATMMQERVPERGMVEALDSTLSGAEPCAVCCVVQEQKKEQREEAPVPESQPTGKWVPVIASSSLFVGKPVSVFVGLRVVEEAAYRSRSDLPECPPPEWLV